MLVLSSTGDEGTGRHRSRKNLETRTNAKEVRNRGEKSTFDGKEEGGRGQKEKENGGRMLEQIVLEFCNERGNEGEREFPFSFSLGLWREILLVEGFFCINVQVIHVLSDMSISSLMVIAC